MRHGFLAPLAKRIGADRAGATAVEFALIAPVLFTLLVGTMNLGQYYYADNSLTQAIDQTARAASVYPTPSDSALQTVFSNSLLKKNSGATMTIAKGTSGTVDYLDLQSTQNTEIDFIFYKFSGIPVKAKRRVYLPK